MEVRREVPVPKGEPRVGVHEDGVGPLVTRQEGGPQGRQGQGASRDEQERKLLPPVPLLGQRLTTMEGGNGGRGGGRRCIECTEQECSHG